MTIEVSTTDRRDGKALALFARWQDWQQGHTRDGRAFFAIPGSEPGLFHMADQNDCSCPDRQRSRNVCKHMRAIRLWMAAYQTGAVAPKPRTAAPTDDQVDLYCDGCLVYVDDPDSFDGEPFCRACQHGLRFVARRDDLIILTPEGATYLAEQRSALDTLAGLFKTCRAPGCQDDPEPGEQDCYRHVLVDAF